MNKLSVVILTRNGMPEIGEVLQSILWADEILVVDSGSTDGTLDECKKFENCRVIKTRWLGFGKAHRFGVDNAKYDNIFNVDQDEIVTPALAQKVQSLLTEGDLEQVYKIRRETFYVTKLIKHCWKGDYPTRLFNRKLANFVDEVVPHEYVETDLKVQKIKEHFIHKCYPDFKLHLDKINLYTENGARHLYAKGKKGGICKAVFHGAFKFIKMYLFKLGFLDGKIGLILSINSAFYAYMKYTKLWQLNKGAGLDG